MSTLRLPWLQATIEQRPTSRLVPSMVADPQGDNLALLCDAHVDVGRPELGTDGTAVAPLGFRTLRKLSFARNDPPESIAWSADGCVLVVGSRRAVHVYGVCLGGPRTVAQQQFEKLLTIPVCYYPSSVDIAVTPDPDKYIIAIAGCTGVELKSVRVQGAAAVVQGSILRHDSLAIALVSFSTSGDFLAVACLDGHLGVWRTRGAFDERTDLWSIHIDGARVTGFSFSPCERLLAVGFWGDSYAVFESVHTSEWQLVQHCRSAEAPENATYPGCFVEYVYCGGAIALIISLGAGGGMIVSDPRGQPWHRFLPDVAQAIKGIAIQWVGREEMLVYFARYGAFGAISLRELVGELGADRGHGAIYWRDGSVRVYLSWRGKNLNEAEFVCVFEDSPDAAQGEDTALSTERPDEAQKTRTVVAAPFLTRDSLSALGPGAPVPIIRCSREMLVVQCGDALYVYSFSASRWEVLIMGSPSSWEIAASGLLLVSDSQGQHSAWQVKPTCGGGGLVRVDSRSGDIERQRIEHSRATTGDGETANSGQPRIPPPALTQ